MGGAARTDGYAADDIGGPMRTKTTRRANAAPRATRVLYLLGAAGLVAACTGAEGPETIADRFWAAVQDGDVETARAYSIESESSSLELEDESAVESYELGEVLIEDGKALVETRVTTAGEWELDISFETVLIEDNGAWKVHVEQTGRRMVRAVIGASTEELVRGIADTLRGAMGEVMEGVAEGIRELGDALGKTAENMQEEDDH
jgi:hypothetical protein